MADRAYFHDFVRSMFCHRRKVLRSELLSARKQFSKVQVDELLAGLGLEPTLRAERLGPEEMLRLCAAVRGLSAARAPSAARSSPLCRALRGFSADLSPDQSPLA